MTLPASHPHAGTAIRLTEAMTDDTGEARAMQEDEDMEKATLATRLAKAKDRNEELDDEAQKLGECLYDLKTHVENADLETAFRYPDTVRSILERAEALLAGRVEGVQRSRADLEAEVERLREAVLYTKGDIEAALHNEDLAVLRQAHERCENALDEAGDVQRIDPSDHKEDMPPSTDRLQKLPEWARHWIQELETRCDPAGDLRRLRKAERKLDEYEVALSQQEAEKERLKERNDVLAKIAYDMRGALQSIADGIGNQKTAEDALHRVASRGIADLDVAPESVGIKGRIEELEDEVERLREIIYEDRAAFRRFRNCAKSKTVRQDSLDRLAEGKTKLDALDGAEDGSDE